MADAVKLLIVKKAFVPPALVKTKALSLYHLYEAGVPVLARTLRVVLAGLGKFVPELEAMSSS